MARAMAERFIDALHRLEDAGDLERIVSLFGDEAELRNPTDERAHRGRNGARHFWESYHQTFGRVHSEFRNVVEAEDLTILEWRSRGETHDGRPLEYEGVTVLEFAADGQVERFRAYFDPGRLGDQLRPRPER